MPDQATTNISLNKGEILIVDDNPTNLDLLSGLLLERNYKVRAAINGKRALNTARIFHPDLIMLDITMPEMDGYEVCQELKLDDTTRHIPVIFISALDEAMDKVKAFEVGGVDYVTKPFQFEEVIARIENQLRTSRLQKELELKNLELIKKNEALIRSQEELLKSYKQAEQIFSALSDVLPGTMLDDKYKIENKIGSGGYGVIYQAMHLAMHRPVAIKVFRPASGNATVEALERFRLEGISACRINHPNAVSVLDSNVTPSGIAYLVMELLQGNTLWQEMQGGQQLPLRRVFDFILPICSVLAQVHSVGIIHRDIKPENIFLHQSVYGEVVKILDFGIAKLMGDTLDLNVGRLTGTGTLVGTPTYMSPERLSSKHYDGKSDIYSLGILFYELLAGRPPFNPDDDNIWALIHMHLVEEPPPVRAFNPTVPVEVENIIMRTLVKNPAERLSAAELWEELQNVQALLPSN